MATMPDGSTIPLAYFQQQGTQHGEAAARLKRPRTAVDQDMVQLVPEFQDPRYQATSADKSAYRTAWLNRYDYVLKQLTPQEKTMAEQATAQEASKLTVEQWEQQTTIPNWSIAKAVAANFNNSEKQFEGRVATSTAKLKTSTAGQACLAKSLAFIGQWNAMYAAIQAESGYTPSTAVAAVRDARKAMAVLDTEMAKLTAAATVTKDVVQPPTPTPPTPDPVKTLPIGAKAKIPGWAIITGIAAAIGGLVFAFRKKKDDPKKLPYRAGA